MRLLILSWRDLAHPRAGGSEYYVQSVARHWVAAGHEVTLFAAAVAGRPDREERDGYTVARCGNAFTVYRQARRFLREGGNYDAVLDVVNTRPFLTPFWLKDTPVVALIHQVARDVWEFEVPRPAALLGRHVLEPRWLSAYAGTRVLTISESSRQSLLEYGLKHVEIVPVGVDPPLPRPLPRKASVPTLLIVGRLAPNKRPDHAVEAHQRLLGKLPDAVLQVVGDGPMADALRARGPRQVEFFGRVGQETKHDLMAAAHAVVGTSVREGWGLTISEAAHLGTRAIGYDVPGLRDSVPPAGGVLVKPDPKALADAAAEWLPVWQREGRPNLGRAGVSSWEEVAESVLGHIRAAIADGAGSAPRPWRASTGAERSRLQDLPTPPRVGVVVPTRNSARTIRSCLESLARQTERPHVVVVDNHSTDATTAIAAELADQVIVAGPERSAQRNAGSGILDTPILAYIDSDMELEPDVVRQAAELIDAGAGGVIVPEASFGEGYWASVRAFERSFYESDDAVEAARFFAVSVLANVGAWDENITGPEDWDLTMRVREVASITRTSARIWHDEGNDLRFRDLLSKKAYYAEGLADFGSKHGAGALVRLLDRPYFREPGRLLWPHPALGGGVVLLKFGEAAAVASRLAKIRMLRIGRRARSLN